MEPQTSDFNHDNAQAQLDANPTATTVYVAPDLWDTWLTGKKILDRFHATYPIIHVDESLNPGEWRVA